jgi:hypothetical protein
MKAKNINKDCNNLQMVMRIPIRARLNSNMSDLKKKLSDYPGMHIIRVGNTVRYILLSKHEDQLYFIDFSKDSIILESRSRLTPIFSMRTALLKLISVLAITKEMYDARFEDVYPYIMIVLASHNLNSINDKCKADNSNISDIILAKRINELIYENDKITNELKMKNQKLALLVSKILISESQKNPISKKSIIEKYGISEELLKEAMAAAEFYGYKCIYEQNNFYMVNI